MLYTGLDILKTPICIKQLKFGDKKRNQINKTAKPYST